MVVIETPKGSPNYGTFGLKGLLPAGAVFPFDFGFVPSTRAEDGDPLDVLVLMDALVFSGALCLHDTIASCPAEGPRSKPERHCRVTRDVEARLFRVEFSKRGVHGRWHQSELGSLWHEWQ